VTVEPLGHIGDGENTKSFAGIGQLAELIVVIRKSIAPLGELLIVVLVEVRDATERRVEEVLGTSTEESVRSGPVGPGVVLNSVEE
jgi:hypothetical protein